MFFSHEELIRDQAADVLGDLFMFYELERYHIFDDARDAFFELESHVDERLGRRILTLAALARVNDDAGQGLALHTDRHPRGVGLLNEYNKQEQVLTAREACNKIIHATRSRLALGRIKGHPIYQHLLDKDFPRMPMRRYARPMLSLVGERSRGSHAWQATVDLVAWVSAVLHYSAMVNELRAEGKPAPKPNPRRVARRAKRSGNARPARSAERRLVARELLNAQFRIRMEVSRATSLQPLLRGEFDARATAEGAFGGSAHREVAARIENIPASLEPYKRIADELQASHSTLMTASLDDLSAKVVELENTAQAVTVLRENLEGELVAVRAQNAEHRKDRPGQK